MRSLGIVAVVTIGANAFAQPAALNEHDVVVAAANRAGLKDVVEGTAEIELGRGLQARAYPNPEVSYTREQTFGTLGSSENYLSVAQAFDLGFRRRIRGEAGDLRAQAARLDGQHTRQQIAAEARLRFYEVLYRQQRVAALERWLGHVQSSLDIVTKREKRGDAAGYERKRFEREAALAAGRVATEQAELARAQTQLRAITGTATAITVTGTLLPPDDPLASDTLQGRAGQRPDFRALDLLVNATNAERKAQSRWWVPELRLELGLKAVSVNAGGRTDGFVAGVGLAIPLWDRSTGALAIARGEARAARGRHALLHDELTTQLEGMRAESIQLRKIALDFEKTSTSSPLLKMTTRGYEAGELTVLELLDAFRGAAEDEATVLEMQRSARRARIELDRLTGAPLP